MKSRDLKRDVFPSEMFPAMSLKICLRGLGMKRLVPIIALFTQDGSELPSFPQVQVLFHQKDALNL